MTRLNVKLLITFLLAFMQTNGFAQQAILTTGGNATGVEGSVSYSIGQIAYTSQKGTNGNVTEGVQQSYIISIINGTDEVRDITLQCTAFPNPVNNNLALKIENVEIQNLTFQLYNLEGKLLESNEITTNDLTISMEKYVKATYFLKINHKTKNLKTFKIIKN